MLGVALLVFAWRTRTRRGRQATPPRWRAKVDKLGFAGALGFLLQPRPLVAAGVATITEASLSKAATVLSLTLFCVLSSAGYLTLQGYATLAPEAARHGSTG